MNILVPDFYNTNLLVTETVYQNSLLTLLEEKKIICML